MFISVQIYKNVSFFPAGFSIYRAIVLKICREDENFFAVLGFIRTFAAPQNMWGVVTS